MKYLYGLCLLVFCLSTAGCGSEQFTSISAGSTDMSDAEMHTAVRAAEDRCRNAGNDLERQPVAREAARLLRGRIVEVRDVRIREMVPYEQAERWHDLETLAGQTWRIAGGCTADLWEDPGTPTHEEYAQQIFQDLGLHKPVAQDPRWWLEQPLTVIEVVTTQGPGTLPYSFFVRTHLIPGLQKGQTVTARVEITNVQPDRVFGRLMTLESEGNVLVNQGRAFPPLSHQ